MLAKLIDGNITYIPKTYEHEGVTYSNYDLLDEEVHLSHGWKQLVETPMPDTEGFYYTPTYTDGSVITQGWALHEIPELPPPGPDRISEIEFRLAVLEIEAGRTEFADELIESGRLTEDRHAELEAKVDERRRADPGELEPGETLEPGELEPGTLNPGEVDPGIKGKG